MTKVKRMFIPTHGRLSRRVAHQRAEGWSFKGSVPSGFIGLFGALLVYERTDVPDAVPPMTTAEQEAV